MVLLLIAAALSAILVDSGCGGGTPASTTTTTPPISSAADTAPQAGPPAAAQAASVGTLHGQWGGIRFEHGNRATITGNIEHVAGEASFKGTLTINGVQHDVSGTINGTDVQATISSSSSVLRWSGKYVAGRLTGSYTSAPSAKAASAPSGTLSMIKFLNIQGVIEEGPWLLYTQDNTNGLGNMTVRVGLTQEYDEWYTFVPVKHTYNPTASVQVKNVSTGATYGPFDMAVSYTNHYVGEVDIAYNTDYTVQIFQYTFSGLPSNELFEYTVTITDKSRKDSSGNRIPYSVTASFRTPPSIADIQSGKVTSQVFYSFGDNRRLYGDDSDHLPMVEENMCLNSGLNDDPTAQTCFLHNGDAVCLGQQFYQCSPATAYRHYGWREEWLRASNGSSYGHDLRWHTWLRASLPTYMSPGNHEGKNMIGQTSYGHGDLSVFGHLMAGVYAQEADHVTLGGTSPYDTYTYMADYGGMRVVVLNVYDCFSQSDAAAITAKMKGWIDGAWSGGPIALIMHPSMYGSSGAESSYWADITQLRQDIQPLINNRKNTFVISGHTHVVERTVNQDVNYYVLGTGGADDMSSGNTTDPTFVPLSVINQRSYGNFAWTKFTVDYKARRISSMIYGTEDGVIDNNSWTY